MDTINHLQALRQELEELTDTEKAIALIDELIKELTKISNG